nr:hypothetical protein [Tanacetum cinerariifolium]
MPFDKCDLDTQIPWIIRAVPISGLGQTMNDHVVSCASIIGIKHRHNVVRDTLVDICFRSGISAVVIDAAQYQHGKYMAKCAAIGYEFLPFSFSSLGELEANAFTLLKRIWKFSIAQDIGAHVAVHIFNTSFAIAKGLGAQIVSRLPSDLLVVPIARLGQTMNGRTYLYVLCYWLDVLLFSVPKPCSTCSKVFAAYIYEDHVVACAGIVGIKHRHNILHDTHVNICFWSRIFTGKEVDIRLGGGGDKPLRPADILLYSWDRGLDVCVDLTGSSPLTQTGMIDFAPGQAVIEVVQRNAPSMCNTPKICRNGMVTWGITS